MPHTAMFKLGGLSDLLALFSLSKVMLTYNIGSNFDPELPIGYRNRKSEVAKMLRLMSSFR